MAKAIGKLLMVAAAIAVVAIPGVGAFLGAAISSAVIGLGVSAAVGLLGLGGKAADAADGTRSTVKNPTAARQYGYGRRRMYGTVALFESAPNGAAIDVYAFADGEADGVEQIYMNDQKVSVVGNTVSPLADKSYQGGKLKFGYTLGATPNTPLSYVSSLIPSIWNNSKRGDGVVTGYLVKLPEKEKKFLETYPQGDNIQPSMVIRLEKNCYDPRTGTRKWTENPVLHLMHYLTEKRGYDYNRRFLPTEQYWIDAANVCDEPVALKNGGTEPRYRSCVTYNGTAQPKEVVASLLETFDGWFAPRGDGALVIYAGKLYAPNVTIGGDEIISYSLPYGVETDQGVDELAVTYVSAAHDYNTVETTSWGQPGLRRDNFGPQTPSYSQNRRLAKRFYSRINEANRGTITTNLGGRIAMGERFINLKIEESDIVFFDGVVDVKSIRRDFTAGGVSIEWVAVDENLDEWNPETEEGEPAALGDRIAPQPADTPIIDSAFVEFVALGEGGVAPRVVITVQSPDSRTDFTWFTRWRRAGDSAWNEQRHTDIEDGPNAVIETGFVSATDDIEVGISYKQGNGQLSDWSATYPVNARIDATQPEDATVAPVLVSWGSVLRVSVPALARASSYKWSIYESDGTTLIATRTSPTATLDYAAAQAAYDGARRSYVFKVAGVNSAGEGGISPPSAVISNPAPNAVTGVTATGGDYIATIDFTASTATDLTGYAVFYSKTMGFDPSTQGFAAIRGIATTQQLYSLGAGTYYARVAALDGWSENPAYLNLSSEVSFAIAIGTESGIGGSESDGGGGGSDGGGFQTPPNLGEGG